MCAQVSNESLLDTLKKFPGGEGLTMGGAMAQYYYSLAIRGDNTPENARSLGYLDAQDLYPDMQPRRWKDYVKDLVAGKLTSPYSERQ